MQEQADSKAQPTKRTLKSPPKNTTKPQPQNAKKPQNERMVKKLSFFNPYDFKASLISEDDGVKFIRRFKDFLERKFGKEKFKVEKGKTISISEKIKEVTQGIKQNLKKIRKGEVPAFLVIVYSEKAHKLVEELLYVSNQKKIKVILIPSLTELKELFSRGKALVFAYYGEKTEEPAEEKAVLELANFSSLCNVDLCFVINPNSGQYKPLKVMETTFEMANVSKKDKQLANRDQKTQD